MCDCCQSAGKELVDSEVKEDTEEATKELGSKGFVSKRGCTDFLCLIIWVAFLVLFLIVSLAGMTNGNAKKLYLPRDYQGAYCGTEKNWNNGPNLKDQTKQSYMMNVTAMTDTLAKQFLCSTSAKAYLLSSNGLTSTVDQQEYLAACCLIPSPSCRGSLSVGGDVTGTFSATNTGLQTISTKMADLTSATAAYNLWSTAGANGGVFNNIWSSASTYLIKTCLPSCNVDVTQLSGAGARTYTFKPPPDSKLSKAWTALNTNLAGTNLSSMFVYKALPVTTCPYDPEYCVPMPGVEFSEISNGYCNFKMGADVINAVGSTMASSFETLGGDAIASSVTETFGGWWGDFERSIDTFILMCFISLIIGLLYLVILRFTVKICVWLAILVILLAVILGGAVAWVRAHQCKGDGLFSTATQSGVAVVVAGTSAASTAASAATGSGGSSVSEACTGDCADYRGRQTRTRNGHTCKNWAVTSHTPAAYPTSGLDANYCRNPYAATDAYKATNIWCYTTSPDVLWEECTPIGVVGPACAHGYAVSGESMRKALEICAWVIWGLAVVWILIVCCFFQRIRLAIALNAVAAKFVANTPTVLVVPVVQALVGCIWVLCWMLLASFLLSQVPADYVPTTAYATYSEAYGTADTPGKCTGTWPTGLVYRAPALECDVTDPLVPKCWKCGPPRYVFDWRFAVSFFAFLWNNAFLIALGQCVLAGAVGVWFFTPNSQKGKMQSAQALRTANWNVWRYHSGSLAFGSFILAVVQFIRWIMYYFEKQAEAQKNRVLQLILKCVQCCILCFERFIQFLNKNAYIQVAIRGTSFCTSAKKAWMIICNNILRFGTIAVLGNVIAYIGYVFIMAATLTVGYFMMQWMHNDISPVIPMIVYGFMSYLVGALFMNVFDLAVDTCLQCVIFAEEKCPDGDFVPPALKSVISKTKAGKDPDAE